MAANNLLKLQLNTPTSITRDLKVELTNQVTGEKRQATPYLDGTVTVPNLVAGDWRVQVKHPNMVFDVFDRPVKVLPDRPTITPIVIPTNIFENVPIRDIPDADLGPVQQRLDESAATAERQFRLASRVRPGSPLAREAARYLVDYKGMTDTFLKGQMQIHQAFWPAGFPGALTDTPYSLNVEKAKKILADAGVKTPINVTLDVINSAPFTDIAQSLQSTFAQAGINFEILPGTGAQVITKYRERTHEAMLLYWGPDFMDPHSNAKAFAYNSNNADDNYTATTTWRNAWAVPEEMNAEVLAALAEGDQEARNAMYVDLQKKVQAESPIVIMFQAAKQVAMAGNVEGFVVIFGFNNR